MSERPPVVKTATEARQGRTTGVVRWVLGISLTLAIMGMIIAFFVSSRATIPRHSPPEGKDSAALRSPPRPSAVTSA